MKILDQTTADELQAFLEGLGSPNGPCRVLSLDLEVKLPEGDEPPRRSGLSPPGWIRASASITSDEAGDHPLVLVHIALDEEDEYYELVDGVGRTLGEALAAALEERAAILAERRL